MGNAKTFRESNETAGRRYSDSGKNQQVHAGEPPCTVAHRTTTLAVVSSKCRRLQRFFGRIVLEFFWKTDIDMSLDNFETANGVVRDA